MVVAPAASAALDGRSVAVQLVASIGLWGAWAVGLVSVLVPSTASLTALRLVAPLGVVAAGMAALAGGGAAASIVAVAGSLLVLAYLFTGEVGETLVQGSAYGDERRFPLRPPVAVIASAALLWLLTAAPLVAGPLLLAASQWVGGVLLSLAGAGLARITVPRLHRLSQRFVVLVPAGFVIHDPVFLAGTAMFRRTELARLGLAPAGSTATDLSAGATGSALEVVLQEPATVTVAPPLRKEGPNVRASAFLVVPSRPGRLLAAAAERSYPVA